MKNELVERNKSYPGAVTGPPRVVLDGTPLRKECLWNMKHYRPLCVYTFPASTSKWSRKANIRQAGTSTAKLAKSAAQKRPSADGRCPNLGSGATSCMRFCFAPVNPAHADSILVSACTHKPSPVRWLACWGTIRYVGRVWRWHDMTHCPWSEVINRRELRSSP